MQKDRTHGDFLPGTRFHWLLPIYDPLQKLLRVTPLHRSLVERAGVQAGQRVLEIGCGTGNLLLLIKRLHPESEVVGLDPDARALARARRKAARQALDVQLDHGFAEDLPYPDGSFDHVFSSLMFHHLDPDVKLDALQEARRVLRSDGALHLLDFGGSAHPSDGLIGRLFSRSPRVHDNLGDRIPALMREAGFQSATETGSDVRRHLGRLSYFRAER